MAAVAVLPGTATKGIVSSITVNEIPTADATSFLKLTPSINGKDTPSPKRRNGDKGYYRNEELGGPIHSERFMRVIVVGAGASALCFAYKLQRSFENFSLRLYEKNPEISGTWFENRYPG